MKNSSQYLRMLLAASVSIIAFTACDKDESAPASTGNNNYSAQVNNLPKEALSTVESTSLSFMREEEKLARDVYTYLYEYWGSKIFNNIASSEQTHMDAVLLLLQKYALPDPAAGLVPGEFKNPALQNLYRDLIAQGKKSILDAYVVGATIEDLDLYDLYNALEQVDNQDITYVYENLAKGSRNHLRSYYRNILNAGGTYIPQFISQAEFDEIISSPMETGF
jgi:hypothetical protein